MSCNSLFEKFDVFRKAKSEVCVPGPQIFFVPVCAEDIAAVNFNGMKTLLTNYLSATCLFPNALRNFKTCLSANSNLCGKTVWSLESQIISY